MINNNQYELLPDTGHGYSVETLYHFSCGNSNCKQWWTIGDFQIQKLNRVVCPHCGHYAKIKELPMKQ